MARAGWFSPAALVLVIVGGAVGVAARALLVVPLTVGSAVHPLAVPAVTLGINLVGSLLLGVIIGWLDDRHPLGRLFLGTGVMGGFTTYSAFAVAVAALVQDGQAGVGLAYALATVLGGALATFAGIRLGARA